MRELRIVIVCLVAVFGLLATPLASVADASPAAPWGYTAAPAPSDPGQRPMPLGPRPQAAPAGAHLDYLGGPVISQVSVQGVYWGAGDYETGAGPGETPITEFFEGVTDSAHFDWLTEYDTTNLQRLSGVPPQSIGRGTYQGQATISVSPANHGTTISDTNITNELERQLSSGALPPPQVDAGGQVKTLYAMFFPETITIQEGSSVGGEPGGFCAYHSTIEHNGLAVPYMVLPDFESHHFAQGCGDDPVLFNNFTAVTAHEILESVTDPAIGLGTASWIDKNTGLEIADICQPDHGTVTGGNGLTLTVQLEYSVKADDCLATRKVPEPPRHGFVNACSLASRTGFVDAGLAADCLKKYGIAQGKNDGTFGENDGLVRSQVSSLLARLVESSGATLTQSRSFPDVNADTVPNAQVRNEIQMLAGSQIIAGFPDGQFHPADNLSVAQAVALVTRTMQFIHSFNRDAPNIISHATTTADYEAAVDIGLLDLDATNIRGFVYSIGVGDVTDRGLLADVLAQAVQRLVDTHVVSKA